MKASQKPQFCASDAYRILSEELAAYRALSHVELAQFVGRSFPRRVREADSIEYAIDVTVEWQNREGGDLCVRGWIAVDDCGPLRRLDDAFVVPAATAEKANQTDSLS